MTIEPLELPAGGLGMAHVVCDLEQAADVRAVLVQVGWRTEGRGERNAGVVSEQQVDVIREGAGTWVRQSVPFAIPAEGPISYDGVLMRIIWELAVRVDIAGGRDIEERTAFRVVVRGQREGQR